jgi:hypothetical protein
MRWRLTGDWTYRSTYSWPRHYLEVSGQLHAPSALSQGKEPASVHWIGDWRGPRICLDDVERRKILPLPEFDLRSLGRPASHYTDCANEAHQLWTKVGYISAMGLHLIGSVDSDVRDLSFWNYWGKTSGSLWLGLVPYTLSPLLGSTYCRLIWINS